MAAVGQDHNQDNPNDKGTKSNTSSTYTVNDEPQAKDNPAKAKKTSKVKKNKWQAANTIAIIAVIVNAFMLLATYLLFSEAQHGTKVAQTTLDSTKAYTRRNDSIRRLERQEGKESQRKKDITDSITFNNQKRSVNAQIASLKETQKEFDIENRPLIQAIDLQFDTLKPGKDVCISFNFRNYGKQPVKCLTSRFAIDYQIGKDYKERSKINWNNNFINGYLTNANYSHHFWRSADTISKESVYHITHGDVSTYIFGRFIYQNTVTNKKSEYDFNFRLIFYPAGMGVESVTNTTVNIK